MVAGTFLLPFEALPAASVDNARASRPLARRLDPDILRRGIGGLPARILGGQRVPHADGVVQAEIDSIADLVADKALDGSERVGRDGLAELAAGQAVAVRDVQREEAQGELFA
ncbi:hypothetical protein CNMCM5623_002784 [Aspergillus felis]|uniref:Uncharacterized protein n=1 Tax=Aspergillus felis TaxID=1287682 RepID=A0A8H6R3G6_9EURO|nr:hypothetical protein CNMCM5623_002784 [Aspergillus felis]KAF7183152.1 hypothetical protein CNMCM7691_002987 [Aspergillus felis]